MLAIKCQGRSGEVGGAVLSVGLMVAGHAADKEVKQERLIGVRGAVRDAQFVGGKVTRKRIKIVGLIAQKGFPAARKLLQSLKSDLPTESALIR